MDFTRLGFIQGALASLSFGTLFGGRLFAAPPGWKHGGKPNLVFGVLADTHLRTSVKGNGHGANWPDKHLVAALEHFRAQDVDAVAHCGDMAHRGQVREMEFHAEAWSRVFGGVAKGPVRLFVTGNHDADGATYGDFVEKRYPDPAERAKHVLATDMAANWERIWGEKYEPVWHKEVKGYHFFGRHWGVDEQEAIRALNDWKPGDGTGRPFFYLQHRRPSGAVRSALMRHEGAVAFFGHNHWSIANWNMAYLYGGRLPVLECASCEPRGCSILAGSTWITKAELEGQENVGSARQGYVVRVYDDMVVFERREFGEGGLLGADWVMPLGKRNPHPFARDELKKVIGEPQFRKGAKLEVGWAMKGAKTTNGTKETPSVSDAASGPSVPSLRLKIPLADGNHDSRVYAYEVEVAGENAGKKLLKAVYAAGCNMGIGHEPNKGVTTLEIPKSELPPGKAFAIAVRPLSSLGTSGKPIVSEFKV